MKHAIIAVISGVSASGKTETSRLLAASLPSNIHDTLPSATCLASIYLDADDYHPESNRKKMSSGIALDDEDRIPWLLECTRAVKNAINSVASGRPGNENKTGKEMVFVTLACSALKKKYRALLRDTILRSHSDAVSLSCCHSVTIQFIILTASFSALQHRAKNRLGHFMPPALLQSQLDTLELAEDDERDVHVVDNSECGVEDVVARIVHVLLP